MDTVSRILELAERNNLSDQDLCKLLNAKKDKIYTWKKGRSKPTTEEVAVLSDYFSVSVEYLLGRTYNKYKKESTDMSNRPKKRFVPYEVVQIGLERYFDIMEGRYVTKGFKPINYQPDNGGKKGVGADEYFAGLSAKHWDVDKIAYHSDVPEHRVSRFRDLARKERQTYDNDGKRNDAYELEGDYPTLFEFKKLKFLLEPSEMNDDKILMLEKLLIEEREMFILEKEEANAAPAPASAESVAAHS